MTTTIISGHCARTLSTLQAASVQMCVTSPPYFGLRDYEHPEQIGQEATPAEFATSLVIVFREVRRVMRDSGVLWVNLGDSYEKGQLLGVPWIVAFALMADGWLLVNDHIWHKPNAMPSSDKRRCSRDHEYLFMFAKTRDYVFDAEVLREPSSDPAENAYRRQLRQGSDYKVKAHYAGNVPVPRGDGKRNKRSVWSVNTVPFPGAHCAPFPPDLIEPCVLSCSKPGDTVLDPFGGSGTTALVAQRHGRNAILCELNDKHVGLARSRVDADLIGIA